MSRKHDYINARGELENPRRLPSNKHALSAESRRSAFLPDFYESRIETCVGCESTFLFSAAHQKRWFEEWKIYVHARRFRCVRCQTDWQRLRREVQEFPAKLREEYSVRDLTVMLENLLRFEKLSDNGKTNPALKNRVRKMIKSAERGGESIGT